MSRRSNVSDSFYGQIKMKCPYKHELGAILVQPRRPVRPQTFKRLSAVLSAPDFPKGPDGELQVPEPEVFETEGPIERGMPVSAECDRCGQTWQLPWEMVEPAIAQLNDTPVVTITPASKPLC